MRIRIGIAGDGSEAEFFPLYQAHPDAELTAHCRLGGSAAPAAGESGIPRSFADFDAMAADPGIDALHISAAPAAHAGLALRALRAGKHVACAPPMALSLDDCRALAAAARAARRIYMLMEPAVYTREFLFVKRLLDQGELGALRFLRGALHAPPARGFRGELPPMFDATPAVAPLLALSRLRAEAVRCIGAPAGEGGAFAVQTALLRFQDSPAAAEFTRAWQSGTEGEEDMEGFQVHGDRAAFAWRRTAKANPMLFRGASADPVDVPDFAHLLPQPVRALARAARGRAGALPHLAHEFLRSVAEGRRSAIDEATAAHWTAIGQCAHASALRDGARIEVPDFDAD